MATGRARRRSIEHPLAVGLVMHADLFIRLPPVLTERHRLLRFEVWVPLADPRDGAYPIMTPTRSKVAQLCRKRTGHS